MSLSHQKYVYIRTFGCQMNEHDSLKIAGLLAGLGYVLTDDPENADLILFNTCTIREKAHHKAMSEIGRAKIYKHTRPGVLVGVCGCVAQEEKGDIFKRYPHVDILFGPDQISKLPALIEETEICSHALALDLINDPAKYQFLGLNERQTTDDELRMANGERRIAAFVSIMKGCNQACSYCIVPSVRGREVCRNADEIMTEITGLTRLGVREVTLLGQSVNSYDNGVSFAGLLRRIALETDVSRIRFTSPHPKNVDADLISEFRENEKLMPHIHLPVQAGSNSVLRRMRRGYTREHYLSIAGELKKARPGVSITTDLIVGFCGETLDDFNQTLDLMRAVEFDSCFAFKYSIRPGTEAAEKFEDSVPEEEKEARLSQLLGLQRETSLRKNSALVGKEFDVLAAGLDKMSKNLVTGRLPDNRIVHFAGNPSAIGNIIRVKITKASANSLQGEAVK